MNQCKARYRAGAERSEERGEGVPPSLKLHPSRKATEDMMADK